MYIIEAATTHNRGGKRIAQDSKLVGFFFFLQLLTVHTRLHTHLNTIFKHIYTSFFA